MGGDDLPKIINVRYLPASALWWPTLTLLTVTASQQADPQGVTKSVGSWGVTQQWLVDWDRLIPLLPQSLPLGEAWLSRPLLGPTGHLTTGLKRGHSTTGCHGNPTLHPWPLEQNGAGRERGAFVKCLL